MLGTTLDSLAERVRRDAHLGSTGPVFTLDGAITAGATQLTTAEDPTHMAHGSVLSIDAELFHVMNVTSGSKVLDVMPGFYGSTPANHADDSIIEVDARVPKAAIVDWAEQEIRSWKNQLFRVVTLSLPVNRSERTYDLTGVAATGVIFLLEVRQEPLSATTVNDFGISWSGDAWPRVEAKLLRDMPTADFSTGFALQLTHFPRHVTDLRVAYATDFDLDPFVLSTDLIADVGLERGFLDVLEQGVRWRALQSSLVSRSDWRAAGMSRDAEEVSYFDVLRGIDMARMLRDRRLADEAVALRSRYTYLAA